MQRSRVEKIYRFFENDFRLIWTYFMISFTALIEIKRLAEVREKGGVEVGEFKF